jgi:hypothetical protein
MIIFEQAKSLLDFNQKLDIGVLDRVVHLMYTEHGDTVSFLTGLRRIVLSTELFLHSKSKQAKY